MVYGIIVGSKYDSTVLYQEGVGERPIMNAYCYSDFLFPSQLKCLDRTNENYVLICHVLCSSTKST